MVVLFQAISGKIFKLTRLVCWQGGVGFGPKISTVRESLCGCRSHLVNSCRGHSGPSMIARLRVIPGLLIRNSLRGQTGPGAVEIG